MAQRRTMLLRYLLRTQLGVLRGERLLPGDLDTALGSVMSGLLRIVGRRVEGGARGRTGRTFVGRRIVEREGRGAGSGHALLLCWAYIHSEGRTL